MNKKKIILLLTLFNFSLFQLSADEGMWIPLLLEKYNFEQMQAKGFKLTAEDIYSVNQACLKDAIVGLGRASRPFRHFCTGEIVSDQGLMLTNHHCGLGAIQTHSTLEHNYLADGFWAMSKEEELPNEDITASILIRIEEVTQKVLDGISDTTNEVKREQIILENIDKIVTKAVEGTHYKANIKAFFNGNEYYMSVYEIFRDVRLVGAPPTSIGNFGGDTDNWMWPRHTGDFSVFRIYAGADNLPADYFADNVPYKPKRHLPVSIKGIEKGDFTMVFGYPGTTTEYLPSFAVKMISEVENPAQISLRAERLKIMDSYMEKDENVKIQYTSKHQRAGNYWKKWMGETRGLKKYKAVEKKKLIEKEFQEWANSSEENKNLYGNIISDYEKLYTELTPYALAVDYIWEAAFAIELVNFARDFTSLTFLPIDATEDDIKIAVNKVRSDAQSFFKNYYKPIDKEIAVVMLQKYYSELDPKYHPQIFNDVISAKYKHNFENYVDYLFSKSILVDSNKVYSLLDNYKLSSNKKLVKDPAYILYINFATKYNNDIYPFYRAYYDDIEKIDKRYITGLREMNKSKVFYPDANSTLRVAYGAVDNYYPRNATLYDYYTTVDGIIEKEDPNIADYAVNERLKELYNQKGYGQYASDSTMNVCFTASNHTTGGNSGSPIINAEGQLIGINFDRNWEGTMSDIMYDPDQCRNISVDIRYVLFIIDKFAGASHLIEEMTVISE